jgi:hypothetical protein
VLQSRTAFTLLFNLLSLTGSHITQYLLNNFVDFVFLLTLELKMLLNLGSNRVFFLL